MRRDGIDERIPTLAVALSAHMHANELRKLVALTSGPIPTRKAELVDLIAKHLEGNGLRTAWQSLDELQKAAVAEVVHSPDTQFPADRFHAKYGRAPSWGSLDTYRRDERPSALRFFFYGGRSPRLSRSVGHGRAAVLQPLRRPHVRPRHPARGVQP